MLLAPRAFSTIFVDETVVNTSLRSGATAATSSLGIISAPRPYIPKHFLYASAQLPPLLLFSGETLHRLVVGMVRGAVRGCLPWDGRIVPQYSEQHTCYRGLTIMPPLARPFPTAAGSILPNIDRLDGVTVGYGVLVTYCQPLTIAMLPYPLSLPDAAIYLFHIPLQLFFSDALPP